MNLVASVLAAVLLLARLSTCISAGLSSQSDDSACGGIIGKDYMLTPFPYDLLELDFYEGCFGSLKVDKEKMLDHIYELNDIFQQYHSFYDIARDPENAEPASYQPELGYTIVGEGEGKVDLFGGLLEIYNEVNASSATLGTFWSIQTLFNQLYDFHVGLPGTNENFYWYAIQIIPERMRAGPDSVAVGVSPSFNFDESGNLSLSIIWDMADGTQSESHVQTMNGKTVQSFYEDLANNPALPNNYQSLGARLNALMKGGGLILNWDKGPANGRPSDILPSSFTVTYVDIEGLPGGDETWYTGIIPPFFSKVFYIPAEQGTIAVNVTLAESITNKPGNVYTVVQRAIGNLLELEETAQEANTSTAISKSAVKQTTADQFEFGSNCIAQIGTDTVGGCFKIEGEYAIFKLSSFMVADADVLLLWKLMANAAKEAGVTDVLIDISGNDGGIIWSGYVLIMAMFPDLDASLLLNAWDIVYNKPMDIYYKEILPIVINIMNDFQNISAADINATLADITQEEMQQLQIAAESINDLCVAVDALDGTVGELGQCNTLQYFLGNVTEFTSTGNPEGFYRVMGWGVLALLEYNPWSVVFGMGGQAVTIQMMDMLGLPGPRTVIQGGAEKNLTEKFDLVNGTFIKNASSTIRLEMGEVDHQFDKYIIVSDGVAGSMAAIFSRTVKQLWQNRDLSGITTEVVTVAYGGTGRAEDMTMASVPASVQGVSLEDPFIASGLLFVIRNLLPKNYAYYDEFVRIWGAYDEAVAYPPYFAQTLPRMPVVSFYSGFMEPGAVPLQYVKMPPDEYVPAIFTKVDFGNTADLKDLYFLVTSLYLGDTNSSDTIATTETIVSSLDRWSSTKQATNSETSKSKETTITTTTSSSEEHRGPPTDPDNMANFALASGGTLFLTLWKGNFFWGLIVLLGMFVV